MREKAHILSSFPLHPYGEHGCGLKLGGKLNVCVLTHNYYAQCNLICGVVLGNGKWELWGGGEKAGEGGYPRCLFIIWHAAESKLHVTQCSIQWLKCNC